MVIIMLPFLFWAYMFWCAKCTSAAWSHWPFPSEVTFGGQPTWRNDITGYCVLPSCPLLFCRKDCWQADVILWGIVGWSINRKGDTVTRGRYHQQESLPLTLSIPAVYHSINQCKIKVCFLRVLFVSYDVMIKLCITELFCWFNLLALLI